MPRSPSTLDTTPAATRVNKRYTRFVFTINNWTDREYDFLTRDERWLARCKWLCIAKETGKKGFFRQAENSPLRYSASTRSMLLTQKNNQKNYSKSYRLQKSMAQEDEGYHLYFF